MPVDACAIHDPRNKSGFRAQAVGTQDAYRRLFGEFQWTGSGSFGRDGEHRRGATAGTARRGDRQVSRERRKPRSGHGNNGGQR